MKTVRKRTRSDARRMVGWRKIADVTYGVRGCEGAGGFSARPFAPAYPRTVAPSHPPSHPRTHPSTLRVRSLDVKRIAAVIVAVAAQATIAHAHDFWIEPSTFRPAVG